MTSRESARSMGNRRPKLLFLCQTLPYPADGGVWIRSYNVIKLLARDFDLTGLCFERTGVTDRDPHDAEASLAHLREWGHFEAFPVPQTENRIRYLYDHSRSLLHQSVYTRYLYDSRAFRSRLLQLLCTETFDVVHADSMDLSGYFSAIAQLPIVCVHHNVESQLLRRRGTLQRGWLQRRYYALQADLMEREERRWTDRVAVNVMVSEQDAARLRQISPGAVCTVVPNGVDIAEFHPGCGQESGIAHIGGTNWAPNREALDYFCEEILPHLRAAGWRDAIRWVGRFSSSEEQRQFAQRHGVELTGYVADVRPYIRDSLCNIVPLRSGGGTRLKILNSWAMGKAVVSTSIGCEGLEASDGENILIRDDPRLFAEAVLELIGDPDLRRRLGENARRTVEQRYSWDVIGSEMKQFYLDLASTGAGSTPA